jgi:hypothetical protein
MLVRQCGSAAARSVSDGNKCVQTRRIQASVHGDYCTKVSIWSTIVSNLSRAHRGGAAVSRESQQNLEAVVRPETQQDLETFYCVDGCGWTQSPLHFEISHNVYSFLLIFSCVIFSDWWLIDKELEFWIVALYKRSYLRRQRLDLLASELCRIWFWM